ncbi:MAG: hypothetical protein IT210_24700 [Armatimonadetes bacterium]|nr:hypothetical protein [Armatimonadota bacterium]
MKRAKILLTLTVIVGIGIAAISIWAAGSHSYPTIGFDCGSGTTVQKQNPHTYSVFAYDWDTNQQDPNLQQSDMMALMLYPQDINSSSTGMASFQIQAMYPEQAKKVWTVGIAQTITVSQATLVWDYFLFDDMHESSSIFNDDYVTGAHAVTVTP